MKKALRGIMRHSILFLIVFICAPAWACNYTMTITQTTAVTICVDGVKVTQLRPDTYKITFANYFPGTRIPIDRFAIYANGDKSLVERQVYTLHEILNQNDVGNLVFDSKNFSLDTANRETHFFTEHAKALIQEINANLK